MSTENDLTAISVGEAGVGWPTRQVGTEVTSHLSKQTKNVK